MTETTTTTIKLDLEKLDDIVLERGGHASPDEGMCVMEAVAWITGDDFSDQPACVSPVLRKYGIALNDDMPDGTRQKLRALIPRLVGTNGDGKDEARVWILVDGTIREILPRALRAIGLHDDAAKLQALAPIRDATTARAAESVAESVAESAASAASAAESAASDSDLAVQITQARERAADAVWTAAVDLFDRAITAAL